MTSERTTWSNQEILQEIFTRILRDVYKVASSPDMRETIREALDDENPMRLRDKLISLQIGPLLELLRFLDGSSGSLDWPGLTLINTITGESLSDDFQWSFSEAESIVIDEMEPPQITEE